MEIQRDCENRPYVTVNNHCEHIRITYVEDSHFGVPAVRVQAQDSGGHLRHGPEIPVEIIGSVAKEILDLLVTNTESLSKQFLCREILKAISEKSN